MIESRMRLLRTKRKLSVEQSRALIGAMLVATEALDSGKVLALLHGVIAFGGGLQEQERSGAANGSLTNGWREIS